MEEEKEKKTVEEPVKTEEEKKPTSEPKKEELSEFDKAFDGFCDDNGISKEQKENWKKIVSKIPKKDVGSIVENIKKINGGDSDWNLIFKSKGSGKTNAPTEKDVQKPKSKTFGEMIKFNKK